MAIILPFRPPTHSCPYPFCFHVLMKDFFSPIPCCLRVNYNPIQAPQTPPPSSLLVKIDTDDDEGKVVAGKTSGGHGGLGPRRAKKGLPAIFPSARLTRRRHHKRPWAPPNRYQWNQFCHQKCLTTPSSSSAFHS